MTIPPRQRLDVPNERGLPRATCIDLEQNPMNNGDDNHMHLITEQQIALILRDIIDDADDGPDMERAAAAIMQLIDPMQSALIRILGAGNTQIVDPDEGVMTIIDSAKKMRACAIDALHRRPITHDAFDYARACEVQRGLKIAEDHGYFDERYRDHRQRLLHLDRCREQNQPLPEWAKREPEDA